MYYFGKVDLSASKTMMVSLGLLGLLNVAGALILVVSASAFLPLLNFTTDIYGDTFSAIAASLAALPLFALLLIHIRKVENHRQELLDLVRTDHLTGLLSREAFLEDFRCEFEQREESVSDAFLIVDADFFKRINDTHGHIAGDRALIAITDALRKGIRKSDRIGRLGGEEFAIHLRGVNKALAEEIAERLRRNVMAASHEVAIPELNLSVSIGAVYYETKEDVVSLLTAADRQLYLAKDNGRNRVEFEHHSLRAQAA